MGCALARLILFPRERRRVLVSAFEVRREKDKETLDQVLLLDRRHLRRPGGDQFCLLCESLA